VDVVALADPNEAALDRAGLLAAGAGRYCSIEELVGDAAIEAVAVCVPPSAHADVACAALAAGRHVLVEKPLAASLEDADRLIEAVTSSPTKAVVGFNFRRHRFVQRARAAIRSGELGRIDCIRSAFTNDVPIEDAAGWRGTRGLGGGGILDRAIHDIDLWRYLLDDDVAEVFAYSRPGRTEDEVAVVTARMRRGALASITVLDAAIVSHELMLYGTLGALRLDLCRFDGYTAESPDLLPGSPKARVLRFAGTFSDVGGHVHASRRGGDFMATYEDEWRRFAEIVRLDLPAEPSMTDGRAALAVALAAIESASSGAPVHIDAEPVS
jgi:myo-inositol 2-dehydrogenase/D-chiro-inositol 1-dehydrogenase